MGIATTMLLPAGSPVVSASTHQGISNGLQAGCTGNDVCYKIAQEYPGEFLFGANEVPDLPGAVQEIKKYLKLGAKVIGERSEEHTSELQSLMRISYAVFCLKKKN